MTEAAATPRGASAAGRRWPCWCSAPASSASRPSWCGLTGDRPGGAAGFWRLAFALPLLALITRRAAGRWRGPTAIALLAGVMFALDLGFWHYGIKYTSVANSTVLSNLTPVVVTAFAWVFLKQRPRPLFLLAVAVAMGGAWMMGVGKGGGAPVLNPPLGQLLLARPPALWYALYFLAVSRGAQDARAPAS